MMLLLIINYIVYIFVFLMLRQQYMNHELLAEDTLIILLFSAIPVCTIITFLVILPDVIGCKKIINFIFRIKEVE